MGLLGTNIDVSGPVRIRLGQLLPPSEGEETGAAVTAELVLTKHTHFSKYAEVFVNIFFTDSKPWTHNLGMGILLGIRGKSYFFPSLNSLSINLAGPFSSKTRCVTWASVWTTAGRHPVHQSAWSYLNSQFSAWFSGGAFRLVCCQLLRDSHSGTQET